MMLLQLQLENRCSMQQQHLLPVILVCPWAHWARCYGGAKVLWSLVTRVIKILMEKCWVQQLCSHGRICVSLLLEEVKPYYKASQVHTSSYKLQEHHAIFFFFFFFLVKFFSWFCYSTLISSTQQADSARNQLCCRKKKPEERSFPIPVIWMLCSQPNILFHSWKEEVLTFVIFFHCGLHSQKGALYSIHSACDIVGDQSATWILSLQDMRNRGRSWLSWDRVGLGNPHCLMFSLVKKDLFSH